MDLIWKDYLRDCRTELAEKNLVRRLRPLEPEDAVHATLDRRRVVLFSSNDYLGLSSHPEVRRAVADVVTRHGMGPRGAALTCGYTVMHEALERELARIKGTEVALLFPTGYAANVSVLSALSGPGTAIFSDAMNHASIIDGCRLAKIRGAEVNVYDHGDAGHLARLLAKCTAPRRLVITDSVFSMDGDLAPLTDLVELKRKYGAMLAIDEAHATLVLGARGGGLAEALDVSDAVDIHVGTLSKAIGSRGGFVATSALLREHLLNRGRSYVYSTSLTLPAVVAARTALRAYRAGTVSRERLRTHMVALGRALRVEPVSPIFHVQFGDEAAALQAARDLLDRGFHVPAIRPPTVPRGSSRLRVSLSAAHTEDEVQGLIGALEDCSTRKDERRVSRATAPHEDPV